MSARIKPLKQQPKPSLSNLIEVRRARGENQAQFWTRLGVTQSAGSRYENGRNIPQPTRMLAVLYLTEAIDDKTLAKARKEAKAGR